MSIFNKNYKERFKNKGKEGLLFILLIVGVFVACQGALEEGNPFGPSTSAVRIIPSTTNVAKAGTLTFTTLGGTTPFAWNLANTAIGNIVADTGVFTALAIAGTSTITVTDAVGDTATASVTVLPNLLVIAPGSSTQSVAGDEVFTATLASGSNLVTATIANDSSTSTFTLPTLAIAANVVTVTFTLPNGTQGDQTVTITITDTEGGDVGAVKLTILNDGT
jgi:large repetitive protein